jgi:hypothetical protein
MILNNLEVLQVRLPPQDARDTHHALPEVPTRAFMRRTNAMCLLDTRKDDRNMTVARNVLSSRVGRITARLRRYEGDADTCHKSEEPDDHARDSIWNTDVCNNGERSSLSAISKDMA